MIGFLASMVGCDVAMDTLKPGISTTADVLKVMGKPSGEWKDADGTTTLEFTRQPEGVQNYMVTFGPEGVLREIRQVLTDANFQKVARGMSKDEIRRRLGKPGKTATFPLKKEEVWTWKYQPQPGSTFDFHVHFDLDGAVVNTSRTPADTAA